MKWVFVFISCMLATAAHAQLKADRVLVKKSEHKLFLLRKEIVYETFHVVFGPRPQGPKLTEGDERTPEGDYILDYKKSPSIFYKSIHISYPNAADRLRSAQAGLRPGGQIMIHGHPDVDQFIGEDARHFNWTNGCIAMANEDMDILWEAIDVGTPITIEP
jgi:murein L,D-transpeptidase YafK